ncbi:MAG: DUF882 domain-containing protein [Amylibacter sp.]|jgi:uncharacterized protein YcbK (DUF882 family)|nr:DUF882 domain-containing protein [Amylibacter sp.]
MTGKINENLSRRKLLGAFAGVAMLSATPYYANAAGYLKGAGNIRKVNLRNQRTGEALNTIYWVEGQYIKPALEEINYFMRDWRQNATRNMDRRNVDLMAATLNLLDTDEPFLVLSGYRTSRTNNMLRSKSRNVAKQSYHVKGMAADLRLGSRSVKQIARAGVSCRSGGVGKYYRSNFVHLDCGPVRSWVS